jgi:type I restriction enzyme, S subunit
MNATQLLADFDRLAEAPNAVPRLRRFILDLAVRGKLVEQDAGDEPAAMLINRIEAEKSRLVRSGLAGKQEVFESKLDADTPFSIPNAWVWVPATFPAYMVSDLGKKVQTKAVLQSGAFPVVDQGKVFIRGYCNDQDKVIRVVAPLILFGDHTRETKLIDFDFVVGADGVKLLQPVCLFAQYYFLSLQWLPLDSRGYGRHFKLLKSACIPLPPLAEQHRIVAKVDELMALCDQLEAAQQERERRRDRLAAASLQRLNQPALDATAEAQREHARFHLHHLPRLTTRPEHIKAMRQAILNLAVRGRLVAQNANEESAVKLLKVIDRERAKLLKANYPNGPESKTQLRKQAVQVLPEGLSVLPVGWTWATLMQCSLLVVDCHNKTAPYSVSGIPLIRTTNVRDGRLNLKEPKFVDEVTYARWSARCEPEPGDILITREAPMGEVAIIPAGMKICLGQRMMLARLVPHTIDPGFLLQSLNDPELMERVQDKPIGATVQHLRVGGVETLLVPLPPLAEQHRIVAKVDELMALCDQLEAQLTTIQTDSHRLLEAVLEKALIPVN